jgi:hypothetical protein
MIADKKARQRKRHRILQGAFEALRAVRAGPDAVAGIKVTPSCGCVFCDLNLPPDEDGMHRGKTREIKCTREAT